MNTHMSSPGSRDSIHQRDRLLRHKESTARFVTGSRLPSEEDKGRRSHSLHVLKQHVRLLPLPSSLRLRLLLLFSVSCLFQRPQ